MYLSSSFAPADLLCPLNNLDRQFYQRRSSRRFRQSFYQPPSLARKLPGKFSCTLQTVAPSNDISGHLYVPRSIKFTPDEWT